MKPFSKEQSSPIRLNVQGLGEVPSFKNSKSLGLQNGKPTTRTKPEYKVWMDRVTASFAFQLRSELQTRGIEIQTGPHLPLLIASLLPLDDSRKWIGEICVNWQQVSKSEEGANVTVERIL